MTTTKQLPKTVRVATEQAVARGVATHRIMRSLGLTYRQVQQVKAGMEEDTHTPDELFTDEAPDPLIAATGRRLSSYYGPASPEDRTALVDAICPPRGKKRAA